MSLKRLETILGLHLKEVQEMKDTINEIFRKATELIFQSIKGEADEGAADVSPKYQKITESLAIKLFLKQIDLYHSNI
jgi:hypothetical protein